MSTCFNCQRIARIKAGDDPTFVLELPASYVVLGDFHAWRGYTLLLAKDCVAELHDLPLERRRAFMDEMALVAHAVWNTFKPAKLNYEMLGNLVPHLHWHIFPRYAGEPDRMQPVWIRYKHDSQDPRFRPQPAELKSMAAELKAEIERLAAS